MDYALTSLFSSNYLRWNLHPAHKVTLISSTMNMYFPNYMPMNIQIIFSMPVSSLRVCFVICELFPVLKLPSHNIFQQVLRELGGVCVGQQEGTAVRIE